MPQTTHVYSGSIEDMAVQSIAQAIIRVDRIVITPRDLTGNSEVFVAYRVVDRDGDTVFTSSATLEIVRK